MLIYRLVLKVRIGVVPFDEITAISGEITYVSAGNYGVRMEQPTTYTLLPVDSVGKNSI